MDIYNNTTNQPVITKNKTSDISNSLLDKDYIETLEEVVDYIIRHGEVKKAYDLSIILKNAVVAGKVKMSEYPDLSDFYKKIIIKLRFIALPLLSETEIEDLMKNYFTWQFRIPYYDLWEKLRTKLITFGVYEDRDKLKAEIKRILLDNKEIITSRAKIKTISEWLRNYNNKLGTGTVKNIVRAQYFIDIKKESALNKHDIEKLKTLFSIYEKLKLSSLSPEGYEEEVPIMINNKLHVFRQGILEPIGGEESKARTVSGPPKTEEEKKIQKLEESAKAYPAQSLEERAIKEEIDKEKRIDELNRAKKQYPPGSLEARAIEEEIKRLEKHE